MMDMLYDTTIIEQKRRVHFHKVITTLNCEMLSLKSEFITYYNF